MRVEDLVAGELRGVGLVDRRHHLVGDARELRRAAEVVVDDARRGHGAGGSMMWFAGVSFDAHRPRCVVVEREVHAGHVRAGSS